MCAFLNPPTRWGRIPAFSLPPPTPRRPRGSYPNIAGAIAMTGIVAGCIGHNWHIKRSGDSPYGQGIIPEGVEPPLYKEKDAIIYEGAPDDNLPDELPRYLSSESDGHGSVNHAEQISIDLTSESSIPSDSTSIDIARRPTRYDLPIRVRGVEILACPDTGAEENIIALETIQSLGLEVTTGNYFTIKTFIMANGKTVDSIGKILLSCSFGAEPTSEPFKCWFYVFQTLASPMIMSDNFVRSSEIMTKHRNRLVPRSEAGPRAISVNAVGKTRKRVLCRLKKKPTLAFADTGSELDLMSAEYAQSMNYKVRQHKEQVMFADGSIGETVGKVRLKMRIAHGPIHRTSSRLDWGPSQPVEFHLLTFLTSEVIIGEDTINRFEIFTLAKAAIITIEATDEELALTRLRLITPIERQVSKAHNRLRRLFGRASPPVPPQSQGEEQDLNVFQQTLNDQDQRELARQSIERRRIATLPAEQRENARQEEANRAHAYDENRRLQIREFDLRQFEPTTQESTEQSTEQSTQTNTPNDPGGIAEAPTPVPIPQDAAASDQINPETSDDASEMPAQDSSDSADAG